MNRPAPLIRTVACVAGLVTAMLLGLATGPALSASPSPDRFVEDDNGWVTYINGRFGMRVSYPPELFTPAEAPADGSGRRFESSTASFEAFGWENEDEDTGATLATSLIGAEGYENIARQEVTDSMLVISGHRSDRAFLEKYVLRGSTVQAFGIEYPKAASSEYASLAAEIADSFLHGDEAVEICGSEPVCPPLPEEEEPAVAVSSLAAVQMPLASVGEQPHFRIIKAKAAKAKKLKRAKAKKPDRKKHKRKRRGKGRR